MSWAIGYAMVAMTLMALGPLASADENIVRSYAEAMTARQQHVLRPTTIDTDDSSWTLQLKTNALVSSSLVRLGDVVLPVSVSKSQWGQLSKLVVGLVPADGRPLRLEQYRLAEALSHTPGAAANIRWVGGTSCNVTTSPIRQASATEAPTVPMLNRELSPTQRLLIEKAIHQSMGAAKELYRYEIDWTQLSPELLDGIIRFQQVAVPDNITEGVARFVLSAQVGSKVRSVPVHIKLTGLPKAIVAARPLGRGEVLTAADLEMKAVPENLNRLDVVDDPELLIGQELTRAVASGNWISSGDTRPLTLVRRNDFVDLQVVGGAIVVRTKAKALGEGGEGDLIKIELIEQRKSKILFARVVGSGTVEIVTRATQVR